MSRNLCQDYCDGCGTTLSFENATSRPMLFKEYADRIGMSSINYRMEYSRLVCCKAECPECKRVYLMWISYEYYSDILQRLETHSPLPDLSYWHTFNDEPCYQEDCKLCYGVDAKCTSE